MVKQITLIYFSLTGNVRHFMKNLRIYSVQQHELRGTPIIKPCRIMESTSPKEEHHHFFACVPTYCSSSFEEIFTEPFRRYLQFRNNYDKCLGFIGNGDRSYMPYCWTAFFYQEMFSKPVIDDFEQTGSYEDVERIYESIVNQYKTSTATVKTKQPQ